jgi:transcriptional regulator with XRE-family HTH domain
MRASINGRRLRREMAIRGLSAHALAAAAGVSPNTITRALRGLAVNEVTIRNLAGGLARIPPLLGADALVDGGVDISPARSSTASAKSSVAARSGGGDPRQPRAARPHR